jgi:hypothetical protein
MIPDRCLRVASRGRTPVQCMSLEAGVEGVERGLIYRIRLHIPALTSVARRYN